MPKLIKIIAFIVILAALILLWAGVLQRVKIVEEKNPIMYGVYLKHYGSYSKVPVTLSEVKSYVKEKGLTTDVTFGVYFQDPKETPKELLTSWVGVVVDEPIIVEEPYELYTFEERDNIHASFQGHPFVAPFKIISKIETYQRRLSLQAGTPWVEIYTPYKYGQYIVDVWVHKLSFTQE